MAEAFSKPEGALRLDAEVVRAVAAYEPRVLSPNPDPRTALFEACVRLAAKASAGPWSIERIADASAQLWSSDAKLALVDRSTEPLYPRDLDVEIPAGDRRMFRLERSALEVLVARDPRELAAIVARTAHDGARDAHLDSLLADLIRLLAHPGALLLAAPLLDPANERESLGLADDDQPPGSDPFSPSPSWLPTHWSGDAGATLADALERGATTQPRVRAAVKRGIPALAASVAIAAMTNSNPIFFNRCIQDSSFLSRIVSCARSQRGPSYPQLAVPIRKHKLHANSCRSQTPQYLDVVESTKSYAQLY